MFKFVVLLGILAYASGQKSPHGEDYLSTLTAQELRAVPEDVLEDARLDVPGLIAKYGYSIETHEVETEDGYLITMHRIPSGKNNNKNENRTPVLLMHGLMGSSADWIINGPGKGLGYILSDEGYDIWLGNARGNFYSRNHVSKDPNGRMFWRFSWNEIGFYDLPAMIDYILKTNGNDKLHYIGHSQGTTSFFVMGTSRPEYNDKIIAMQAFAPVAYMSNMDNPLVKEVAKYADTIQILLTLIGQNEFFSKSPFITQFAQNHCHDESEYYQLCLNILYGDDNYDQLNITMVPAYLSHAPAGASSRQFVHYGQEFLSGKFRKYDFGSFANIAIYDKLTPPNYNLRQLTAPVALHFSDNDNMVHELDVVQLHNELPNSIGMFRVPLPTFTHLDFIWAIDARSLLYDNTINIMKSYDAK